MNNNSFDIFLASASPRRRELLSRAGVQFEVHSSQADETLDDDLRAQPEEAAKALAERKAYAVVQDVLNAGYAGQAAFIAADTMVICEGEIFGKPADETDALRMLQRLQGHTHQVTTGVSVWLVNAPASGEAGGQAANDGTAGGGAASGTGGEAADNNSRTIDNSGVANSGTTGSCNNGTADDGTTDSAASSESNPESDEFGLVYRSFYDTALVTFHPQSDEELRDYLACGESFDKAGAYAIQGEGARLVSRVEGDIDTVIGLPVKRLLHEFPFLASAEDDE